MALVLSLKENDIFYIEDTPYIIRGVSEDQFYIDNLLQIKRHTIDSTKMVEIYPEVKVSAGFFDKYKTVKLVVEGPRRILVEREERRNDNIS